MKVRGEIVAVVENMKDKKTWRDRDGYSGKAKIKFCILCVELKWITM